MLAATQEVERQPIELVRMRGKDEVEYYIQPMALTLGNIQSAWDRFSKFEVFSDDGPQDLPTFTRYVIEGQGLWFEMIDDGTGESVGLIYISNITYSYNSDCIISAMIHAVAWDAKAAPRRVVVSEFLRRLFPLLKLHRLEAQIPMHHGGAIRTLKRLGFVDEGRKRQATRYQGVWRDVLILSLLESEVDNG